MSQNIWWKTNRSTIKYIIYNYHPPSPPPVLTLPAFYQLVCYIVLKKPCARQFSPIKQRRLFDLASSSILLLCCYCTSEKQTAKIPHYTPSATTNSIKAHKSGRFRKTSVMRRKSTKNVSEEGAFSFQLRQKFITRSNSIKGTVLQEKHWCSLEWLFFS